MEYRLIGRIACNLLNSNMSKVKDVQGRGYISPGPSGSVWKVKVKFSINVVKTKMYP